MNLNNEKIEIARSELKIKELAIKLDMLDEKTQTLFEELGVTPEQISEFIDNKENFTEESWEIIVNQKVESEKRLQAELNSVKDPRKTKKSLSSLNVKQHWIPVR